MTPAIDPIVPWPWIALAAIAITALTVWAYEKRLRGTEGRWRWFALGLRLLAVLLCVLACLRPSILFQKKDKQPSSIAFAIDASASMTIKDEARGKRWVAARESLAEGMKAAKTLGLNVNVHAYRFARSLSDDKSDDTADPKGSETAMGTAMSEAVKRETGGRLVALVLLSDGASNAGQPPMIAAQSLKTKGVPVIAVGFGTETGGAGSKDLAVRSMMAGPTVFVKNDMPVTGMINARGFAGQEIEVELLVEGQLSPVERRRITVPPKATEVPIAGLKWTPTRPGEAKVTLRVVEKKDELIATNNEFSTFVKVLGGGLNVLFIGGPTGVWEPLFLVRALDPSQRIQVTFKKLNTPAGPEMDGDFNPEAYDAYILGDVPASFLTPLQQALLVRAVERGAGLIMLGGRSSFGAGGWAKTDVSTILPTIIRNGDDQNDPKEGIKVIPSALGLDTYVTRLAQARAESKRLWESLPPIPGANRLGDPKVDGKIWLTDMFNEPIMVGHDSGKGRVIAFGGETWPWARFSDESHLAHLKLWRQIILWLTHKENDDSNNQIRLSLDRRRVSVGGRVELTVLARDAKGDTIPNLKYSATVTRDAKDARPESVDVFPQGSEAKGTHFVTGQPGDYKVTVTATDSKGALVGTDTSRFIAYQDDRELENPAADLSLLRQIADVTGGKYLAPEALAKYLKTLDKEVVSETYTEHTVRIWDNWWFLLLFAAILTLEWWLRKKHGWV